MQKQEESATLPSRRVRSVETIIFENNFVHTGSGKSGNQLEARTISSSTIRFRGLTALYLSLRSRDNDESRAFGGIARGNRINTVVVAVRDVFNSCMNTDREN